MKTKFFIGTSGFMYDWNPDGLEWYLQNSGLNALEINMPFYRFPFPSMVTSWAKKTKEIKKEFKWAVKVNRLITHVFKFNERAFSTWKKFEKIFSSLDSFIAFYLFQLPPSLTIKAKERIAEFAKKTELGERFALEAREISWFGSEGIEFAKENGITFVSVDAPAFSNLPRDIFCTNGNVYLRMHGRTDWYFHNYSDEELEEILQKIFDSKPKQAYVFFNNDHGMLQNAQKLKSLVEKWKKS
jgi:uncharacterized protein YecE (DUF72 family)